MATKNIMIVGVGGQGTLLTSRILGGLAIAGGYDVKLSEVHGMSQRGGDVQSNLRISSEPIHSDLIPLGSANVIISLEPMEALRYLEYLKKDGWVVTSTVPFVNIPNYPAEEELQKHLAALPNCVSLNVEQLAKDAGAPLQAANMVLLGAAIPMLDIEFEKIEAGIRRIFARKGEEVIEKNLAAVRAGYENSIKK